MSIGANFDEGVDADLRQHDVDPRRHPQQKGSILIAGCLKSAKVSMV
jgi:ribosomal protein L1